MSAAPRKRDQQAGLARLSSNELARLFPGYKEKIAQGLAEAKAGKLSDGESFFRRIRTPQSEVIPKRIKRLNRGGR